MIPVIIHTALASEAKPLIATSRLRKVSRSGSIELFSRDDLHLVVSGSGTLRAAAALGSVCTRLFPDNRNFHIVNIGIAGSSGLIPIGTLCSVVKCVDRSSQHEYLPDLILRQPGKECVLETHSKAVEDKNTLLSQDHLVDMEGSAVFESGRIFASTTRVQSFKVVSDFLSSSITSRESISELIESCSIQFLEFVSLLQSGEMAAQQLLSDAEMEALQTITQELGLTFSQNVSLLNAARFYKSRYNCLPPLPIQSKDLDSNSRSYRNSVFLKLRATLEA